MNNKRVAKQRTIISDLQNKKFLSEGQERLDLTTEIVNQQEKLNKILYPKPFNIMKTLFLILAVFIITPTSMRSNFMDTKEGVTIEVTKDLMICRSFFKEIHDRPVYYIKPLKVGRNEHYFVPLNNMGVRVIVTNY